MKLEDLSLKTRLFISKTACSCGLTEDQVINRFYEIFRRRKVSRHSEAESDTFSFKRVENTNPNYISVFS